MKGILKRDFKFIDVTGDLGEIDNEGYDEENLTFNEGQEFLILKVIENAKEFSSNIAFVIFNEDTLESLTVDSSFVTIINSEFEFGEDVGKEIF